MPLRIGATLVSLAVVAAPLMAQAPSGWRVSSESQVSLDTAVTHSGHGSGRLRGLSAEDFVTLRQGLCPDSLRGQRVRFSGYVRTNLLAGTAGLWMRVDGEALTGGIAFDNMSNRPIQGITPWTRYEIVLDIPREASTIVLGVLMVGQGDVWLDDVVIEPVGREVVSTDLMAGAPHTPHDDGLTEANKERIRTLRRTAPAQLRNPGFEQRP